MAFFFKEIFSAAVIFCAWDADAARHAVLKSNEVNWRKGPGPQYPIVWTYQSPGWPVIALRHWDHWWYIQDSQGAAGWVHSSLLYFKHHVLVVQDHVPLRLMPSPQGSVVAYLRTGVIGKVLQEKNQGEWLLISLLHKPYKGWVHVSGLWQDPQMFSSENTESPLPPPKGSSIPAKNKGTP